MTQDVSVYTTQLLLFVQNLNYIPVNPVSLNQRKRAKMEQTETSQNLAEKAEYKKRHEAECKHNPVSYTFSPPILLVLQRVYIHHLHAMQTCTIADYTVKPVITTTWVQWPPVSKDHYLWSQRESYKLDTTGPALSGQLYLTPNSQKPQPETGSDIQLSDHYM